jgi:hypothetical protein
MLGVYRGKVNAEQLLVLHALAETSLMPSRLTFAVLRLNIEDGMHAEQSIAEIERLERMFAVPDTRPLSASDLAAANRRHDAMLANSPWFRLWQQFGVCCRSESDGNLRIQS